MNQYINNKKRSIELDESIKSDSNEFFLNKKKKIKFENSKNSDQSNNESDFNNKTDSVDILKLYKLLFNNLQHMDSNKLAKKTEILCKNPLCNHKTFEEDPAQITIPDINVISSINDLIVLGKSYHCKKNTQFAGMNLRIMCNLVQPLTELSNMIGMQTVKNHLINQILFFLQGNHNKQKCNKCVDCTYNLPCLNSQTEMLHTVISGPPGVGKTEFGKILGKIYKEMGILTGDSFKLVTRADLIGSYLGHTAAKTQKVIDEAKGGVLFIDEAYSLGNSELRDSFSKECIDTLNQNLSERRDFLCIIAGYENELEKCFFAYNEGLRRRFTFRYNFDPYDYNELFQIFEKKVEFSNWTTSYKIIESDTEDIVNEKILMRNEIANLFKKNVKCFPNYGGDMETLLLNCKIIHTKRCTMNDNIKRSLTFEDIENGISTFTNHRKYHKKEKKENININMYNIDFDTDLGIYK